MTPPTRRIRDTIFNLLRERQKAYKLGSEIYKQYQEAIEWLDAQGTSDVVIPANHPVLDGIRTFKAIDHPEPKPYKVSEVSFKPLATIAVSYDTKDDAMHYQHTIFTEPYHLRVTTFNYYGVFGDIEMAVQMAQQKQYAVDFDGSVMRYFSALYEIEPETFKRLEGDINKTLNLMKQLTGKDLNFLLDEATAQIYEDIPVGVQR